MQTDDTPNNIQEGWNSYRKLVVDTLRRLDERTLELYERSNEHVGRLAVLEQVSDQRNDRTIKLESDIKDINTKLTSLKEQTANRFSVARGVSLTIGTIWGIITLGISIFFGFHR